MIYFALGSQEIRSGKRLMQHESLQASELKKHSTGLSLLVKRASALCFSSMSSQQGKKSAFSLISFENWLMQCCTSHQGPLNQLAGINRSQQRGGRLPAIHFPMDFASWVERRISKGLYEALTRRRQSHWTQRSPMQEQWTGRCMVHKCLSHLQVFEPMGNCSH